MLTSPLLAYRVCGRPSRNVLIPAWAPPAGQSMRLTRGRFAFCPDWLGCGARVTLPPSPRLTPARRRGIAQGLVGTLVLVVDRPFVQRLLGQPEGAEHPPRVELQAQGAVEALDLAGGGGRTRLRQQVLHPV